MKKIFELIKKLLGGGTSLEKAAQLQELQVEVKKEVEVVKEVVAETKERLKEREIHLKHKKSELDAILAETEKEEKMLHKKSEDLSKLIEERLLKAYNRIRSKVNNGLAVVSIERGASGGSS